MDYIFGVDGANIEDLYDAAYFRADITAVLAKHEFSAATMADGYSRASSGLGVVAATSGGGSLNLVAGLGESFTSRVPVLALVGQPPTTLDGRGSFQDTSGRNGSLCAEALFSEISVYCRRVLTPADIVTALPRGGGGRPHRWSRGVVAAEERSAEPRDVNGAATNGAVADPFDLRPGDPHPIARALQRARGPVTIIAGEQVARDDARAELEELRTALRRPRSRPCPTPRTSAGRPVWARRRRLA